MPRPLRHALHAVLAACLLVLAGCVTTESPVTRFYVLDALPETTAALPGAGVPVAVDLAALRLPQYLERPQIVTRSAANRLELAEYDQWGGNLAKNLSRVLARNLARLLATPDVTIFSRRPLAPADVRIEVEVMQFEREPDGRVLLAAQWRLSGGDGGAPAIARMSELRSPAVADGADMAATVQAMSDLVGELSRAIAAAVLERPRP